MISLYLIGVIGALIIISVILLKFKEIRHRTSLFIIIVLILFIIITFGQISKTNNTDLKTFDGLTSTGKIYFSWLIEIGKNLLSLSGYAINQDWSLKNASVNSLGDR